MCTLVCVGGGCWGQHEGRCCRGQKKFGYLRTGVPGVCGQPGMDLETWAHSSWKFTFSLHCLSHLFRPLSVFFMYYVATEFPIYLPWLWYSIHYFTCPRGSPIGNTEMVMQEMTHDLDPERRMGLWCACEFTQWSNT